MRDNPVTPALHAAALSACALESELLNSERIGERFGSYGIEVMQHGSTLRRSSLFSIENGVRICRTYAVVQFLDPASPEIAAAHETILAGNSIGATFKSTGWTIGKETLHVGNISLPGGAHEMAALMQLDCPAVLGMHVYRLILDKNTQSVHYASIIEAHHPDYLNEPELRQLYATRTDTDFDSVQIDELTELILDTG